MLIGTIGYQRQILYSLSLVRTLGNPDHHPAISYHEIQHENTYNEHYYSPAYNAGPGIFYCIVPYLPLIRLPMGSSIVPAQSLMNAP